MVTMDIRIDDKHSATLTSAVEVTERRATKRTPKNKRKDAKWKASQEEIPSGIGGNLLPEPQCTDKAKLSTQHRKWTPQKGRGKNNNLSK